MYSYVSSVVTTVEFKLGRTIIYGVIDESSVVTTVEFKFEADIKKRKGDLPSVVTTVEFKSISKTFLGHLSLLQLLLQ